MHCNENDNLKRKLLRRLKKIEGQVRGLQKMLEEDEYCIDIINQSNATKCALRSFEAELLDNHVKTCVVNLVKKGKASKAAKELVEIYKANSNRKC